jgi:hypothetical protein
MRIACRQAGLLIIPLPFIFMLNTVACVRFVVKQDANISKLQNMFVYQQLNLPVWFHFKGHNPRNIPLFIPVIFHRKGQMVVDEVLFVLALLDK